MVSPMNSRGKENGFPRGFRKLMLGYINFLDMRLAIGLGMQIDN